MELKGLRAIMVGGASGMARATAERIVAEGGAVAILDRDQSDGRRGRRRTRRHVPPVRRHRLRRHRGRHHEAVDALGGLTSPSTPPAAASPSGPSARTARSRSTTSGRSIDLNLIATFNVNRLAAWHMNKNEPNEDGERGVIINTASIAAFEGQIGQVAYTAAKAGIAGMSLTMARDLGSLGIRVQHDRAEPVRHRTHRGHPRRAPNGWLTKDAAFPKRMGRPDEFAKLAIAIIENPMLNGGTIRLDAGQRFGPK